MSKNIVAVSLFSGAGGLDIASFMAGVPVISSTDFDSDCIETLKENEDYFGEAEIFEGDLHQIESSVFSDIVKKKKPDKFIVIGGAPCQPFSKAGYWVGTHSSPESQTVLHPQYTQAHFCQLSHKVSYQ